MAGTYEENKTHQSSIEPKLAADESHTQSSSPHPHVSPSTEEDAKKWGTHIMGSPAVPGVHPDNQKASLWSADDHQQISHQPYVQYAPVDKPTNNPFEPVIHLFNSWSTKAETIARNIWHNRKLIIVIHNVLI